MKHLVEKFKNKLDALGDEFIFTNVEGDEIPVDDYMDDIVPNSKVECDLIVYKSFLEQFLLSNKDINEKELAIAIFCNFCIKTGIVGRHESEEHSFVDEIKTLVKENVCQQEEYMSEIVSCIIWPTENCWNRIYEMNAESTVANIYKFIRLCFEYSKDAELANVKVVDVNAHKSLWEVYSKLPFVWKEYVTGRGELFNVSPNHACTDNYLPYIDFCPKKDMYVEYITQYYNGILANLGIDEKVDSGNMHNELRSRLGLSAIEKFFKETVDNHEELVSKLGIHDCIEKPQEVSAKNRAEILNFWIDAMQIQTELFAEYINKSQTANSDLNVTFLIEKLHSLYQLDQESEWFESAEILEEYSYSQMSPALRSYILKIPVMVEVRKELFESHYELYKKNSALEIQARKKAEMMDYYAHSWKHISYPQIVKEIAEELGSTNRVLANRLMKAYNSEKTLQRSIQLLQYISSDNEEKVKGEFRNGVARSGKNVEGTIDLMQVICESLDLVVFKLLMVESDDSKTIEKCRIKWEAKHSMEILREEYTKSFLNKENGILNILTWVSEKLLSINLNIDEAWESVRFKDDSFTVNQFKEILVEIFTNVLLHGKNIMYLSFESNDEMMIIKEKNKCSDSLEGSRSGISTMKKVLEYINYNADLESLVTKKRDGEFEIDICFDKKLLIRKGR